MNEFSTAEVEENECACSDCREDARIIRRLEHFGSWVVRDRAGFPVWGYA